MDLQTKILLLKALTWAEEGLLREKDLTIFEYVLHYEDQEEIIREQKHTNRKKFVISQLKRNYENKMRRKKRNTY